MSCRSIIFRFVRWLPGYGSWHFWHLSQGRPDRESSPGTTDSCSWICSGPPEGLRHLQQFRPYTVTMVTAAWHLWQWQIDWPQWNIWDDIGRARVRRHTIKTSGHEGTQSQLHLEKAKELHGQTRLRVKKKRGGGGTGRVSISSWHIVEC